MMIRLLAACTWLVLALSACPDLQAGQPVPQAQIARLASEQFGERQKAYAQLREWAHKNGESSAEILHGIWKTVDDPEAKTRCYQLMREVVLEQKFPGKGFMGIRMEDVWEPGRDGRHVAGVRIIEVLPDTPALKVGLQAGDTIVQVDDVTIVIDNIGTGSMKLMSYIQSKTPGREVTLHLLRGGKRMQFKVRLMRRPPEADPDAGKTQQEANRYFEAWLKAMAE